MFLNESGTRNGRIQQRLRRFLTRIFVSQDNNDTCNEGVRCVVIAVPRALRLCSGKRIEMFWDGKDAVVLNR